MKRRRIYTRSSDSADMIEIAPHRFVNVPAALAAGLVTSAEVAAARKRRK